VGHLAFDVAHAEAWDLVNIELSGFIEPSALEGHGLAARLSSERPVVFFGRAPVWLFGHLAALVPDHPWVACGAADHGAIVVRSNLESMPVGHVIPMELLLPLAARAGAPVATISTTESPAPASRVVAIVGPPHSGKTVFLGTLYSALEQRFESKPFWNDVFFVSSAPDGEGKWSAQIPQRYADILRRKGAFTMDFAERSGRRLNALRQSKRLVVADLGGRIDGKQGPILRECTHVLVVSRNAGASAEWRGAAAVFDLPVIGEVESLLLPCSEVLDAEPFRCRVGPFERGNTQPLELPNELIDRVVGDLRIG
jgi:CRISPR-associated protein Csx3